MRETSIGPVAVRAAKCQCLGLPVTAVDVLYWSLRFHPALKVLEKPVGGITAGTVRLLRKGVEENEGYTSVTVCCRGVALYSHYCFAIAKGA